MATKAKEQGEIQVMQVQTGTLTVAILGKTPIILNRLSEKARHELLMPGAKKTAADKAANLKHDPIAEFRAAPYRMDDDSPTLLGIPTTAVKGALRSAALDMPGTTKSQIGRLTYVSGEFLSLYGVPKVFTTIVRSADMNRTPDVRTRAIVPKWAMLASITFQKPLLREQAIANLLAAAGLTVGIGDFRPEKGAGNYGQFELVDATDKRFTEIVTNGTRVQQQEALDNPEAYNAETEELLAWFDIEVKRRGFKIAA